MKDVRSDFYAAIRLARREKTIDGLRRLGAPSSLIEHHEKVLQREAEGVSDERLVELGRRYVEAMRDQEGLIESSFLGKLIECITCTLAGIREPMFEDKVVDDCWIEFKKALESANKTAALESLREILGWARTEILFLNLPSLPLPEVAKPTK